MWLIHELLDWDLKIPFIFHHSYSIFSLLDYNSLLLEITKVELKLENKRLPYSISCLNNNLLQTFCVILSTTKFTIDLYFLFRHIISCHHRIRPSLFSNLV